MQFTIVSILLIMFALAAIYATVVAAGIESAPLLLVPVVCIAIVVLLRRGGNKRLGLIVAATYVGMWILTAGFSPTFIKARYPGVMGSSDISWKYGAGVYPPIVARGISIQTQAPWHYCHIRSSPCPLITVADFGELNENKSGAGGRTWFLWLGNTCVPLVNLSAWKQN